MAIKQELLFHDMGLSFADSFLDDHVGPMLQDPRRALVELVANAYDAGATEVRITWPNQAEEDISIEDNGEGMTREDLIHRWTQLCYQRRAEQGRVVTFNGLNRSVFGREGKGRHAVFCFSDCYFIQTWKGGMSTTARVEMTRSQRDPFKFHVVDEHPAPGRNGTLIWAQADRNLLDGEVVYELLGDRFAADTRFGVFLNERPVDLLELGGVTTEELEVPGHGSVRIHRIASKRADRSGRLRGVSWWVKKRRVGEPGWERSLGDGLYLDGRSALARRLSIVVEADLLEENVILDWTYFREDERLRAVREAVDGRLTTMIESLLVDGFRERKLAALRGQRAALEGLSPGARNLVGRFVDETLRRCPRLNDTDLGSLIQLQAQLQQGAADDHAPDPEIESLLREPTQLEL